VVLAAQRAGQTPIAMGSAELDVTDAQAAARALAAAKADAVINCAAWTDVDGAESHPSQAAAVNATGAGNLADAAASAGVPLLHLSTDYVFDGRPPRDAASRTWPDAASQTRPDAASQTRPDAASQTRPDAASQTRPYVESDPTGPLSVYGRTKLAGERLVLGASSEHAVVRTAWLFGIGGRNFVATMLGLAEQRNSVQVVDDQTGSPTWTGHLAPALIGLLRREVRGLLHLAGGGAVTWNGFAREIFRQASVDCEVEAIDSAKMARPAPRPSWSVLQSEREEVVPMPDWRDGLAGYLAARDAGLN
jgi:dTDP-4-dehydrorhamnose reductase